MRLSWCSPTTITISLLFSSSSCCSTSSRSRIRSRNVNVNVMASLHQDKVVVLMGATGCGKSRLSIDLATHFPSEVINSDKIQLHHGLDITTNKLPLPDRRNVPHHLLGHFHANEDAITPSAYRRLASAAVSSISSRRNLPLLVGGSNSFIHALLARNLHDQPQPDLRYHCCFIWVDVSLPVLSHYLSERVDDMIASGMVEELAEFYADPGSSARTGLRRAIGVPEFESYFRKYPPEEGGDGVRARAYEEAVREIKENTRQLVRRQLGKIQRLREAGWDLNRVDATEAFRVGKSDPRWSEIWEAHVLGPSVNIVKRFLE